ncbi:MAG: hypothetical protein GY839_11275 [candidate division Zixibacteria bacterium]|nr:hypothetical protein [candidate division Zixibacteria bacterium]
MDNSIKTNNWRLNKYYRIIVITAFAILMTIGPFGQTILSAQTTNGNCCKPGNCCCMPWKGNDLDNISQKCGCAISESPNIPQLPLGLNFEQFSRVDISFGVIEFKSSEFNLDNHDINYKATDYSIGLKAPPLYLINSSFLI